MSPNATWKEAERRVGKMIGSTREGPTGESGFDVVSEELGIGVEVKYRKRLPQWLWDFVAQADVASGRSLMAEDPNAFLDPVVVLVEKGRGEGDFLCVLRFRDYLQVRRSDPV